MRWTLRKATYIFTDFNVYCQSNGDDALLLSCGALLSSLIGEFVKLSKENVKMIKSFDCCL